MSGWHHFVCLALKILREFINRFIAEQSCQDYLGCFNVLAKQIMLKKNCSFILDRATPPLFGKIPKLSCIFLVVGIGSDPPLLHIKK